MKNVGFAKYTDRTMVLTTLIVSLQRYHVLKILPFQMIRLAALCCPHAMRVHECRVGLYAAEIYAVWARRQGIPSTTLRAFKETLRIAAMLHDIGKIAIPDTILYKADSLNQEEYAIMKQHTVLGARLFLQIPSSFGKIAAQVALNHHERWDGSGYPGHIDPRNGRVLPDYADEHGKPRGKQGTEIPFFARIVAIADVYAALSSWRVYKDAWEEYDSCCTIEDGTGTLFDPELVEVFFASLDSIRAIQSYGERQGVKVTTVGELA